MKSFAFLAADLSYVITENGKRERFFKLKQSLVGKQAPDVYKCLSEMVNTGKFGMNLFEG